LNHKKLTGSYLVLFLFIIGCSIGIYSPPISQKSAGNVTNLPKANDNELTLITPENKTYTRPDRGYYPATYGFENVINGQDDPDWNDVSSQKGNIISEMDGHEKVYEVTDNSGSSAADLLQYYDIQSHGTVEFWCRFTSAIEGNYYRLSGPVTLGPTLNIYLNQFQFTNSSGGHPIPGAPIPQVNTWYHIRFDFRGSYSSEYSGLTSQYTYFIYINTIRYGPFTYEENGDVDTFQVHTSVAGSGFTIWWDAVGYSWDPNYNIGDNLNEGLLLSYDTNSNLNWTGYSSDGQLNETILGNTTIPMPSDGHHNIQVFGNDSMGVMAESDVRYFTTNVLAPSLSIISPLSNDLIGNIAPLFSLNIPDGDLNDTWYSLDEGTTTIPFTSLSGTIDQTEWDKISNGTATLTFYANDTANNIGQAEVTIRKDIIAPVITIFSPSTGIKFDYAPVLETVITEGNLDEFWYTIDEGVHNYTLTGLSDTIDQDSWNSAPNGPVTIRFYARDLAGNVGTNYVIVVKISTQQPPAIPGYDLSLIIGIFSIISILIIRKRLKS
jgi:hypothetical protein